jgi:hypothetical protein
LKAPLGKDQRELISFQEITKSLPTETLDRDLAEISYDIDFLKAQVSAEIGNYTPAGLEKASEKIFLLKQKAEIAKLELLKRNNR